MFEDSFQQNRLKNDVHCLAKAALDNGTAVTEMIVNTVLVRCNRPEAMNGKHGLKTAILVWLRLFIDSYESCNTSNCL